MTELVLGFLRDGLWGQHAVNFALFPVGLYALHRLLRIRSSTTATTSTRRRCVSSRKGARS
jgi:hypothetical protein